MSPLSAPVKRPNFLITRIRNTVLQTLNYIRPEILLAVFLFFAIVFAFLNRLAIGFYIVFGIFIAGYFIERITRIIKKKPIEQK